MSQQFIARIYQIQKNDGFSYKDAFNWALGEFKKETK
jgi:hypothetical protein